MKLPTLLGRRRSREAPKVEEEQKKEAKQTPEPVEEPVVEQPAVEEKKEDEPSAPTTTIDETTGLTGNLLGSAVKSLLSNFDSSYLGVSVEVGELHIDPLYGKIQLDKLTISNPEGYKTAYLLHADKVLVDVDVQALITSFGNVMEMEEIMFEGVDVIYEKSLRSSNINDVLKKLDESAGKTADGSEDAAVANQPKLVLHKVDVKSIGAKVSSTFTRGFGPRLEVGDIHYKDFETEVGSAKGVMAVMRLVFATLLKSILASLVGHRACRSIVGAAHSVSTGIKSSVSSLSSKGSKQSVGSSESTDVPSTGGFSETLLPYREWLCGVCTQPVQKEDEVVVAHVEGASSS